MKKDVIIIGAGMSIGTELRGQHADFIIIDEEKGTTIQEALQEPIKITARNIEIAQVELRDPFPKSGQDNRRERRKKERKKKKKR